LDIPESTQLFYITTTASVPSRYREMRFELPELFHTITSTSCEGFSMDSVHIQKILRWGIEKLNDVKIRNHSIVSDGFSSQFESLDLFVQNAILNSTEHIERCPVIKSIEFKCERRTE
jgi:hypothetical protein